MKTINAIINKIKSCFYWSRDWDGYDFLMFEANGFCCQVAKVKSK